MSGGLSRRAAAPAPVAVAARSALARAPTSARGLRRHGPRSRSASRCPSRPAAPPTPWRASSRKAWAVGRGGPSPSRTGPAPAPDGDLCHDSLKDFARFGLVTSNASAFVPDPALAAHSFPDVARLSPRASRRFDVASPGPGSSDHLPVVRFARTAAARLDHPPHRGAGPALTDVTAGVVPPTFDSRPFAAGRIRAGSVRAFPPEGYTAFVRAEAARREPLVRAPGAAVE